VFGFGGCRIADIREVDWYRRTTREYDYAVVSYWGVTSIGSRTGISKYEEIPPSQAGPDYPYICTACDTPLWFWSDVIEHTKDAQSEEEAPNSLFKKFPW